MLGKLLRLILKIISWAIVIIVFYIIALMFDLVPTAYTPPKLFPEQYKAFKDKLAADAKTNDSTSSMSKYLSSYIDSLEEPKPVAKSAQSQNQVQKPGTTQNTGIAPIDHAKQAVQNYNEQQQKEKQQLDNY